MIITAIITIAYSLLYWLIQVFPASQGFPAEASTAFTSLGGYLGIFSPILPLSTLATCVALVFTVELGIFAFKSIKWIISHIPAIGGKGH
jgi:hypothetical protein